MTPTPLINFANKPMPTPTVTHVSDTALWVAAYRALESARPDALFRDPLAGRLAGERGKNIATSQDRNGFRYTGWAVVIRTHIIDRYIRELLAEGVDTVINLGAGLDARPYRLELPASLRWIEVDYPHVIELKEEHLAGETPTCQLQRVKLDLADRDARQRFFAEIGAKSGKVLVLTEGVVPYLTKEQVASLAEDLHREKHFQFWIVDYFSPQVLRLLHSTRRRKHMGNAPFQFDPGDWFGFFTQNGWWRRDIHYLPEESLKLGRPIPMPWWAKLLSRLMSAERRANAGRSTGYALLEPRRSVISSQIS
jgi:methyltransferase (TIGR00027 family)